MSTLVSPSPTYSLEGSSGQSLYHSHRSRRPEGDRGPEGVV